MATKKGGLRKTSRRAYKGLRKRRNPFKKGSSSFTKLESQKLAMGRRLSSARRQLKDKGTPTMAAVCTTTGGALGGGLSTVFPEIMGISSSFVLGGALVAFGIYSDEKYATSLACIGSGLLAAGAADYVRNGIYYANAWNPIDQPGILAFAPAAASGNNK